MTYQPIDPAVFAGLQRLLVSLEGCNANDKAVTLIKACIDTDIRKGSDIVAAMSQLGFDPRHAGATLRAGRGINPATSHWHRAVDGSYANLA